MGFVGWRGRWRRVLYPLLAILVLLAIGWFGPPMIALNQSSLALAKSAYAARCSPLSLLECPPAPVAGHVGATLEAGTADNATDPAVRRNQAFDLILQKHYDAADGVLRQVVTEAPGDNFAAFALAALDLRAGRADETVAIWRRLDATPLVAGYASLATQGHDLEGARTLYALAVQAKPDDNALRSRLATAESALRPPSPKTPPKTVGP